MERRLGFAYFRNVRNGAEPSVDLAPRVPDRPRAREKPPVGSVMAPKRKRSLPRLTRGVGAPPCFDDPVDMLRMMYFLPPPPLHVFE